MRAFMRLHKRFCDQFARFGTVGLLSFGIDYGVMLLLTGAFGVAYLASTTVSFLVALVFNYLASMKFVFHHRDGMGRRREFGIFAVLSAVGLCLNELYMFIGVDLIGIGYQLMKCLATFLVTWYNFFSRRHFLDAGAAPGASGAARRA